MSSFEQYFYKNVGKQLRYYRQLRGFTQEKLSEILGMNDKYIGHVERCERKISTKMLIQIMEFFQIKPRDFFNF